MSKFISIPLFLAALTALSCDKKQEAPKTPVLQVETAIATIDSLANTMQFVSTIAPLYSATIQPRVSGYLSNICFSDETPIEKGALLFTIEPGSLATSRYAAEAELESALANEVAARNNYNRAVPLAEISAISQSSLDGYTADYRAAKALVKARKEALKSASLNYGYTNIYAPIDGIIASTTAKEGDLIGPDSEFETLTTIAYTDTVSVTLAIPTSVYFRYRDTSSNSYDNADLISNTIITLANGAQYPYKGEYYYTKQSISPGNSTIDIVVRFANPELSLQSGMFARLKADIGSTKDVITIPQRAVSQMQGINTVWVINTDSTAHLRNVELGDTIGTEWIIESGIEAGERVACSGQMKLHEGDKVKPIIVKR